MGSAKIAHEERIDVGMPTSQQFKGTIPRASFTFLVGLVESSLGLPGHLLLGARFFVKRV
jgi:hypothetical protein